MNYPATAKVALSSEALENREMIRQAVCKLFDEADPNLVSRISTVNASIRHAPKVGKHCHATATVRVMLHATVNLSEPE